MTTQTLPTLFVPHGAGPCFFMDWTPADTWSKMATWLRSVPELIGTQPKALLLISGHWEASPFTVNAQAAPPLLYDYSGFPPHTYDLEYAAPGSSELAARVQALLDAAGISNEADHTRGLDHGVFIPMKLAFPDADVPIVQLSLKSGLSPAEHLAVGRALVPLRREGVLIIGSGMSFHNMQRFRFEDTGADPDSDSVRFDAWLSETVGMPADIREQRLIEWAEAPGGRASHPREEHLLPLHVVAGAAGDDIGHQVFQDRVIGSMQSAFMFGG
ncbi:DODA-type extradiol aromatic ring-opening family dioxygenase [Pseudohongiella sp.]|jgi:aromatic ring-opening dioxygenase catalytic subunit (LigB family)|uniref:Extradiol ring-cleavage dioxygenase class III enzyme subunit B domain-containing protein n=1 Tax=marine sediment metagenome TaxID=412755 RepID=A0A0F9Z5T5_9ZZZZ|nr:class III extradiol ring-cleavage dioxygenase [Pseudohongiella sp.]HDZ09623.1 dioxygenase [Pseudohongiella sp.]HEA61813.1 dioxygenase [Pseudohongiella sp.]